MVDRVKLINFWKGVNVEEKKDISLEDFLTSLDGTATENAGRALMQSLVNFFPTENAKAWSVLIEKTESHVTKQTELLQAKAEALNFGDLSTDAQESPE